MQLFKAEKGLQLRVYRYFEAVYLFGAPMKLHKTLFAVMLTLLAATVLHAEEKLAKLAIIKAEYGDLPNGNKTDVTEKVKSMANAEGLSAAATNDNFGDPADGIVKKLRIEYTLDDQKLEQIVNENDTLTISTKPSRLRIAKAFYGDLPDGAKTDVTAKVQAMIKDDALSVGATNDNFGDPVEGTTKKLKVEYTFDGAAKSKEASEGDTLTISNKGE
jgi:hypothetical protein